MTSPSLLRNCGNPSERVEKWGYAMLLVITLPLSCAATYSDLTKKRQRLSRCHPLRKR
jgi:hypothetical protein